MKRFTFWLILCAACLLGGITLAHMPPHWQGKILIGGVMFLNVSLLIWVCHK